MTAGTKLWLLLIVLISTYLLFGGYEWLTEKPERVVICLILISWFSLDARLKSLENVLLDIDMKLPEPKPSLEYLDALESLGRKEK